MERLVMTKNNFLMASQAKKEALRALHEGLGALDHLVVLYGSLFFTD